MSNPTNSNNNSRSSSSDSKRSSNTNDRLLPPFFISHSGSDRVIVDSILRIFQHHNNFHRLGRPHRIMNRDELSRSQKPHWEQIKDAIQESDAVLLILTRGITQQKHTQNWVAFEVGVAAGCDPPKRVIAIRAEGVQIPIPYLDHYYSYSTPFPPAPHSRRRLTMQHEESQFNAIMYPMLSNVNYKPHFPQNHCPHCKLRYYHHSSGERPFKCPCCSNLTIRIDGGTSNGRSV